MLLFDTHCHFNDPKLYEQLNDIISRAKDYGVDKFIVVGWDKESSLLAIKIAEKYDCCFATVGFHPSNIKDITEDDFNFVMNLYSHPKVVAIGEIGLDYYWDKDEENHQLQKYWFIKQIEFANKVKKPISIHSRDAFADTLNILKEHKPEYSGVVHCYSGSVESLKEILDLGLYIGLDGPLTFKNAVTPKEVCYEVPLERLLLETDSPYLPPHPLRGTVNEPKNLTLILEEVANIKELSKKHISEVIYDNSCRLFNIKK